MGFSLVEHTNYLPYIQADHDFNTPEWTWDRQPAARNEKLAWCMVVFWGGSSATNVLDKAEGCRILLTYKCGPACWLRWLLCVEPRSCACRFHAQPHYRGKRPRSRIPVNRLSRSPAPSIRSRSSCCSILISLPMGLRVLRASWVCRGLATKVNVRHGTLYPLTGHGSPSLWYARMDWRCQRRRESIMNYLLQGILKLKWVIVIAESL